MADRKITDLTALAAGSQATGDLLPIVDVSEAAAADKNKKITVESLFKGIPGNVGIGTTSPTADGLHIVNSTQPDLFMGTSTNAEGFKIVYADSSSVIGNVTSTPLRFVVGNTERARIDSSGRLLVGATDATNAASYADNLVIGTVSGDNGMTIVSGTSGAGSVNFSDGTGTNSTKGIIQYSHHVNALYFYTDGSERMRIDSSGNVGINQTPTRELSLHSPNNNNSYIHFTNDDTGETSSDGALVGIDGNEDLNINNQESSKNIILRTGGSERMRIDSSGRAIIGDSDADNAHANGDDLIIGNTSSGKRTGLTLVSANDQDGQIIFSDGTASGNANVQGQIVYDHSSNYLALYAAATERFRIDTNGQALFYSTGNPITSGTSGSAGTTFEVFTGVHSRSSTTSGGTVSIKIFSNGNIQNTNNSYGSLSDAKLKENIVDASSQWDDIKDIRVRNYNFIEGETHTQLGVVAQEVETVSPGLVYETPDKDDEGTDLGTVTKSVNYSVLYMKAVKALQEAMDRIETLETKVAALEAE